MEKAQKGDLIRIISTEDTRGEYENGDILEVSRRFAPFDDGVVATNSAQIFDSEYVIHRKAGEEDSDQDAIVSGVGPDAPTVTNEAGAKQSHSPYRMDLIDAKALLKIAQVHKQGGDKYGDTNWRGIPVNDHINHALVHIYAHLAGDTSDDHLSHAATRMIFALAQELDAKSTQDKTE